MRCAFHTSSRCFIQSCITAMQATTKEIFEKRSVAGIEKRIATVNEVFRLQNQDEYLKAEEHYLPKV